MYEILRLHRPAHDIKFSMSYHFRIEERRDLTTKLTYKMDTEMKKGGVPGIKPAKKE